MNRIECYEMSMPRQSRIDTSGALHHVICRGIDRQKIFTDQNDYLLFLKRLAALLTETRTSCIAWALIPNPFHLLLRTGNVVSSPRKHSLLRLQNQSPNGHDLSSGNKRIPYIHKSLSIPSNFQDNIGNPDLLQRRFACCGPAE